MYIFTAFNFYCYCCQYYHFAFNNNVNSEIIKKKFYSQVDQNDRISGLIQLRYKMIRKFTHIFMAVQQCQNYEGVSFQQGGLFYRGY